MITLTDQVFDPGALLTAFCAGRTETGAVASFTGLARAEGGDAALAADDPDLAQALSGPGVQVAIDKAIVRGEAALSSATEVAFLPPMSGG